MENNRSASGRDSSGHTAISLPENAYSGNALYELLVKGGVTCVASYSILCGLGIASGIATPLAALFTACDVAPDVIDWVRQTNRRIGGIPQHALIKAIPGGENDPKIYNEKIRRRSPYTLRYKDERYTITLIACLPESTSKQSPEFDVVEGGINHSYVEILLKPEKGYEYACQIIINGKERKPHSSQ